ncbi:CocE/NonD family hydrolase [Streptomyces sp. NPDC048278]|uniref:CocE/NonD family hydrolase n=1 Tax=Streptomyces sp. NPDC048278 TaxID=3155809 RepID=UPI0034150CED
MTNQNGNAPADGQDKDEAISVVWRDAVRPSQAPERYPSPQPGTEVVDGIRCDRDVAVTLRDGTVIYADIYRPEGADTVPTIIGWSQFGKRAGIAAASSPAGVPAGTLSPAAKFEGPDPDYWCRQGYAIANPDPRGVGHSEGDIQLYGHTEARDIYDFIEWVAVQEWSNGRVGMAGNSNLAVSQWWAAAERPPHLACIAPWEGVTDYYRQALCPGGIPELAFMARRVGMLHGSGRVEDINTMLRRYPAMNAYWEGKIADLEKIEVPAYIAAGWNCCHLTGTLEAFQRIASPQKWLRIHREYEWPDQYAPENLEDLRRFFDRFLKGQHNGWELTPRVRLDVQDAGEWDHRTRRREKEWPLARAQHTELFLDAATGTMSPERPGSAASADYDSTAGSASFDLRFDEDTELTGYMKLRLWVEADGANDMDLFVLVQKVGRDGEARPVLALGQPATGVWWGAAGMLRVSCRETDPARSTPAVPYLTFRRESPLAPGEIVPVDIPLCATSRFWHKGERLRVVVTGNFTGEPGQVWFPYEFETRNRGRHVLHTGGDFDSHLLVPVVPGTADAPVTVDPEPLAAFARGWTHIPTAYAGTGPDPDVRRP